MSRVANSLMRGSGSRLGPLLAIFFLLLLPNCLVIGAINDAPPLSDTGCPNAVHDPAAPVLFFSDIAAGPGTGGENNLGPFITLYGLRFGERASGSKVTIGGVEVAKYVAWNPIDSAGDDRTQARELQRIIVQPGNKVMTGDLVVTSAGKSSNALTYTVRSGHIFLVDPTVATNGDGSFARPFADLYSARGRGVQAGDIVFVKGGVYDTIDPYTGIANHDTNFILTQQNVQSGANDFPIAYVGYPGEPPTLGGNAGGTSAVGIWIHDSTVSNYIIANFTFSGSAVAMELVGNGHRLIGNKFTGQGQGITTASALDALSLQGNLFLNLSLAAADLAGPITHVEVGWNEFSGCAQTLAFHTPTLANDGLVIHDNYFSDGGDGATANIGLSLGNVNAGFQVYNNIFNGMQTALDLAVTDTPSTGRTILHNTVYNGAVDVSGSGPPGRVAFENNVIYASDHYFAFDQGDRAALAANHDLYFGGQPGTFVPDVPPLPQNNPLFSSPNAGDFSLALHSPALGAGVAVGVCADYLGVVRPNPPSVGAVEETVNP